MPDNRFIPTTLTAKNKPGWALSALRKVFRIEPETYEQDQKIEFTSAGIVRPVRNKSGRVRSSGRSVEAQISSSLSVRQQMQQ